MVRIVKSVLPYPVEHDYGVLMTDDVSKGYVIVEAKDKPVVKPVAVQPKS